MDKFDAFAHKIMWMIHILYGMHVMKNENENLCFYSLFVIAAIFLLFSFCIFIVYFVHFNQVTLINFELTYINCSYLHCVVVTVFVDIFAVVVAVFVVFFIASSLSCFTFVSPLCWRSSFAFVVPRMALSAHTPNATPHSHRWGGVI